MLLPVATWKILKYLMMIQIKRFSKQTMEVPIGFLLLPIMKCKRTERSLKKKTNLKYKGVRTYLV
jgi:hypothetical protein